MAESKNTPWVIELSTPQMPKPLQLHLEKRLVIGRSVWGEPKQADVDLGPYGAEEQGVSRSHLAIYTDEDRLMVMDLESGNGSKLNDEKLTPLEGHPLRHNDKLILGRMPVEVRVIVSPTYGGDVHKHPSLQLQDQMHPGQGQLVLIVEDDPQVAKILSLILERAGYTPRISHEVVGAIRLFNQKRPSAVILDVMLPGMSGLEFCRYVRRDVRFGTVPIIIVSAAKSAANVADAMQAGADIFLEKPISANELRHVVSSLIAQHEAGNVAIHTKHLVGTAPLKGVKAESRRDSAVFFVAGYGESPMIVNVKEPMTFGRAANPSPTADKTHIDLGRYDAVNYGVSRVHMRMHNRDGKFYIEDLDTVNGTYLNGKPIKAHEIVPVKNADEIRLGRLRMYVYFLEDGEALPE